MFIYFNCDMSHAIFGNMWSQTEFKCSTLPIRKEAGQYKNEP